MTPNNFNWFLHSLLFLHTQCIIKAQKEKVNKQQDEEDDDDDDAEGVNIDRDE